MARGKRKAAETGYQQHGRHTFHRHEYEIMRAFVRAKIEQVQRSLGAINLHIAKRDTPELRGQRDYWATVLSWLNGIYRGGMASMDAGDWDDAWTHVTTVERHAGADTTRKDQPVIPGME